MVQELGITVPVLVDEMDNLIWHTYGPAPNIAYLIGTDGKILVKQGWYQPQQMEAAIEEYLEGAEKQIPAARLTTRVEVVKDIEYGLGGDVPLLLDIYIPEKLIASPMPAVIFIHGGGWRGGDKYPSSGSGQPWIFRGEHQLQAERHRPVPSGSGGLQVCGTVAES